MRTLRVLPVVVATGILSIMATASVVGGAASSDLVAVPGALASRGSDAQVAPMPPAPPRPAPDPIAEVVERTNQARAQYGLAPLVVDPQLQQAALLHSQDQAASRRMSHTGSNGSGVGQRVTATGYRWRMVAENVAAGQRTAASVSRAWLDSPGHRANMLHAQMAHIGVAVAYSSSGTPYWTMVLGAPR